MNIGDVFIVSFILPSYFLYSVHSQDTDSNEPEVSTRESNPADFLETEVLGFRLWMILGFVTTGFLVIIIILCCIFDCRIPRTKQQIEADHERRELLKKFKKQMEAELVKGRKIRLVKGPTMPNMKKMTEAHMRVGRMRAPGSPQPGPSSGIAPLAQHPAMLMMGSLPDAHLRKALGSISMRPGQAATAKTLASLKNEANNPAKNLATLNNEGNNPAKKLASLKNEANNPAKNVATLNNEGNNPAKTLASLKNEANSPV